MASIEERKRADGTTGYCAEVVIRINGKTKKKSATFDRLTTAKAWSKRVEADIRNGRADEYFDKQKKTTVGGLIKLYLNDFGDAEIGKTKRQVLNAIDRDYKIESVMSDELTSHDVTNCAREVAVGRCPSTVMNYLQHLSAVIRSAKAGYGIDANKQAVSERETSLRM